MPHSALYQTLGILFTMQYFTCQYRALLLCFSMLFISGCIIQPTKKAPSYEAVQRYGSIAFEDFIQVAGGEFKTSLALQNYVAQAGDEAALLASNTANPRPIQVAVLYNTNKFVAGFFGDKVVISTGLLRTLTHRGQVVAAIADGLAMIDHYYLSPQFAVGLDQLDYASLQTIFGKANKANRMLADNQAYSWLHKSRYGYTAYLDYLQILTNSYKNHEILNADYRIANIQQLVILEPRESVPPNTTTQWHKSHQQALQIFQRYAAQYSAYNSLFKDLRATTAVTASSMKKITALIKKLPTEGRFHRLKAMAHYRLNQMPLALKHANLAIKLDPNRYQYFTLRGKIHQSLQQPVQARADFRVAITLYEKLEDQLEDK